VLSAGSTFSDIMHTCYTFDTAHGPFHILFVDAQWWLIYDGESLGRYATPELAACDLSSGAVPLLADGTRVAELAISGDLNFWRAALVR